MKALTTILMLCLPVAAMGEIFACTSTYGVAINEDSIVAQGIPNQSWIVDTRRGVRVPAENNGEVRKDYIGECKVSSVSVAMNVWCSAKDLQFPSTAHLIEVDKLTTGEITFKASMYLGFNASYAGTCIEI